MEPKWFVMFTIPGHALDAWWLPYAPNEKPSRCDRCGNVVYADRARLRVANGLGPKRQANHGHRHQYLCLGCAWMKYQQAPPGYQYIPPETLESFDQGTLL